MGGKNMVRDLSSVDILDTSDHTVMKAPSMTAPRVSCSSAVVGHRIFVVGGHNEYGNLDSVEYLDFVVSSENEETRVETAATVTSSPSSSSWTTHSDLVLSELRLYCTVVAVGSCLVVAANNRTMQVLDTHHNRVWNLPALINHHSCSMVTVANQIAIIGGYENPTCATLPLMDKNSWCFQLLCEQHPNACSHS